MNEIEQIKDRLDITEIISSYLTLKRAGANFKGLCPFHNEKTPSFMVSSERQTFKCFGCGEGGDVFTFIEKIEGVDFYNALKILADRAGVQLQSKSITHRGKEYKPDQKTRLFEINKLAKQVYHAILTKHPKADKARKYLKNRRVKNDTISDFEIGYAPDSWDFIIKFLKSKSYQEKEISQAGIAVVGKGGRCYDRFRDRIIFPINNIIGNTVGFTTRTLKDDVKEAKYINSSESLIFEKGKIIYGLDKAKMEIKKNDLAIMVEGNMDTIACHQAGFKNVVASSGTAVTAEQLKILSRYAKEIAFSFDSDQAGVIAMKRAVAIALENDISVKIVSLPAVYKDPDEAISKDKKNWSRAVEDAKPALEYWINLLLLNKRNLTVIDKKEIAKEILPIIKKIYSDIEREHYIKYLSLKLSVSEKALYNALQKTKSETKKIGSATNQKKYTKLTDIERILGIICSDIELFRKLNQEEIKILSKFTNDQNHGHLVAELLEKKEISQNIKDFAEKVALTIERDYQDATENELLFELKFLIKKISRKGKEEIKELYAKRIKEAEIGGDIREVSKILKEFSELIKE